MFNHSAVNKLLLLQLLPFKISKNYCLSPESRVAIEENMNLSSFFLIALGNQGGFLAGRHCIPKWALGSFIESTGFVYLAHGPLL